MKPSEILIFVEKNIPLPEKNEYDQTEVRENIVDGIMKLIEEKGFLDKTISVTQFVGCCALLGIQVNGSAATTMCRIAELLMQKGGNATLDDITSVKR